jgi:DNA replicative helicase MCM subunit Mcm2 (Cdc46/Mcm family)
VKALLFCVHENMQFEFYLKGGAVVLANGRVAYIDEFDKM